MDLSSDEQLTFRNDLNTVRGWGDQLVLLVPTFVDAAGYDSDGKALPDVSIGLGRTASWLMLELPCTMREVTMTLANFGSISAGAELGDFICSFDLDNRETMERVIADEYAYVFYRGERWRPVTIESVGIGTPAECQAILRRFGAQAYRATGY